MNDHPAPIGPGRRRSSQTPGAAREPDHAAGALFQPDDVRLHLKPDRKNGAGQLRTVRREIDRALAERRLDAPERFAQVQVARLVKALRLAEAAIELGESRRSRPICESWPRSTAIMSWRGRPAAAPASRRPACRPAAPPGR